MPKDKTIRPATHANSGDFSFYSGGNTADPLTLKQVKESIEDARASIEASMAACINSSYPLPPTHALPYNNNRSEDDLYGLTIYRLKFLNPCLRLSDLCNLFFSRTLSVEKLAKLSESINNANEVDLVDDGGRTVFYGPVSYFSLHKLLQKGPTP